MDFITEWITNIILFVLIATVIDLLLPNTSMQKYTKMVAGLLLIAIILSPILKLLSNDLESALSSIPTMKSNEEKNIENLIDLQKKEIQASTHAYILEEMAVQLQADVEEELMEQHGVVITNIDFVVDENSQSEFLENLQQVIVQLGKPSQESETVEVVKKIEIDTSEPLPSNEQPKNSQSIATLLSEKWDIENEKIQVVVEGGSS